MTTHAGIINKPLNRSGLTNYSDLLGKVSLNLIILGVQLSYKQSLAQVFDKIFSHMLREAIQSTFELLVILSIFNVNGTLEYFSVPVASGFFLFVLNPRRKQKN